MDQVYPNSCARNYLGDIVVLATTSLMRYLTQGASNEFSDVDRAYSVRFYVYRKWSQPLHKS
jgi:hypothetical protein